MTRKEAEHLYREDFDSEEELENFLDALEEESEEGEEGEGDACKELADERPTNWYD